MRRCALIFACLSLPAMPVDGYFEPNLGQAPSGVQFLGRGGAGVCHLDSRDVVLLLRRGETVRMGPVVAKSLRFEPDGEPLPGFSAYFRGSDPSKWIPRVPHYARVRARDALPGVDLVYHWTDKRELEYDFVLKPGIDASSIRMRFSSRLTLDPLGALILHTALGPLRQAPPRVYQRGSAGEIREVAAAFRLGGESTAGFEIAPHDPALGLVIDPVLQFSTFLGSSEADAFGGMAADAMGNVYITGSAGDAQTPENGFPVENPWRQGGGFHRGATDAFVTKLGWDAARNRPVLQYSTFLGGSGADAGLAISVTPGGVVHIAGRTASRDFPLVKPIAVTNKATGDSDAFAASLSLLTTGELSLAFATRIGGSGEDQANAIAVDPGGDIFVGGAAGYAADFPTANALSGGGSGASGSGGFVLKLVPTSDTYRIAYSTILGSEVRGLALSPDAACHVTGVARAGLPVVNAVAATLRGPSDAFVARLQFNASTSVLGLGFATYLGGSGDDAGNAIAFAEPGFVYVAGQASAGFPVSNPIGGNETVQGSSAAFVARLTWDPVSNRLAMPSSTLLTGGGSDGANALAASPAGIYVTGSSRRGPTGSRAFPTAGPLTPNGSGVAGDADAFVSLLRFGDGSPVPSLAFSTLIGGPFAESGGGLALDPGGGVFVAGSAAGGVDFPAVNPLMPHGGAARGPTDLFVLRLIDSAASAPRLLTIRNSGGGTVSGPGIVCRDSVCTLAASGSVVLTALAQPDRGFAGWSGACGGVGACGVILDSDKAVNAQFGLLESLAVRLAGNGRGSVYGAGVTCGSDCAVAIPVASTVTLKAISAYTGEFTGWTGNVCSGSVPECTFPMAPGAQVTANFGQRTLTSSGLEFVPIPPCRAADTRLSPQGAISAMGARSMPMRGGACGIPPDAAAYSLNVTVVPGGPLGYLTVWPTGSLRPVVSTLNSLDGRVKGNAAIIPAGSGGEVSAFVTDASHVILDVNGYFRYGGRASANTFHPVTPCRVVDTRSANGPLGGPALSAARAREFSVVASGCGIPPGATAYSFNITAIPRTTLGFLTVWPGGQAARPQVSTLNATTGTIVANAAIVPASAGGSINAFATDDSDLIVDINGYFGGPATGDAGGLLYYPVAPCRIADTRLPPGPLGGPSISPLETRDINPSGKCALPPQAKAYAANATILPRDTLGYLTVWPADAAQPLVSTLNALDGAITANGAILPAAAVGSISFFSTDWIDVILDVNGFFAP